jgi:hypothetical protein
MRAQPNEPGVTPGAGRRGALTAIDEAAEDHRAKAIEDAEYWADNDDDDDDDGAVR